MAARPVFIAFLIVVVFLFKINAQRKVTTELLQCSGSKDCHGQSVGYVKAAGTNDVYHYLFSPLGLPTVFVAVTSPDVQNVTIDWSAFLQDNLRPGSVHLDPQTAVAHYTYSVLFTKLVEYNDTKDYADMSKYTRESTYWNVYDLDQFTWLPLKNVSNVDHNTIVFKAAYKEPSDLWQTNGTFSIKLSAFTDAGREDQLPHMQYNENITQFDVNIDHVWTNLSASRFGVEMVIVGHGNDAMKIDESQSIDDEYSPGVFTLYNWLSRSSQASDTGFLQWKPVCYQALARARNKATGMKHYKLVDVDNSTQKALNKTVVRGYYTDLTNLAMKSLTLSFGLPEDGGYNKTQVLTWSGSIGYGTPPTDSVSTLVIIIISIGLGLPVVLIMFGGIFVCYKKRSAKPERQLQNVQNGGYQSLPAGDD